MYRKRRGGFSLVEILVVLAIVAALMALFLAVFTRTREKARQTTCLSNIKQMNAALHQYVSDNEGNFPHEDSWQPALLPYLKAEQVFQCPTEPTQAQDQEQDIGKDYELNVAYLNNAYPNRSGWNTWRGLNEASRNPISPAQLWTIADSDPQGAEAEMLAELETACGHLRMLVRHSGGSNFGFWDGHAKWITPHTFAEIECALKSAFPR